ncbi:hypothetical protein WN55_04909 [Dufourea novaeangliae]|uniref:Transmembrane protein 218 n=1 Tax=Dufourea novaeangliae TaxID=178035 RepID=A0A154PMD3_DUFNO|nr:hypothetical protein WN55_04909 [Dufourea novaeangliae]
MTNLVFGVGIGLFLIFVLWALALFVFIITLRVERKIGAIAILIVSICTVILIALPRASEKSVSTEKKTYDHLFIWRILLLTLLILSSIIGLIGYVKFAITDSVRPIRITNWIF